MHAPEYTNSEMNTFTEPRGSTRDVLYVLFRHKWKMAFFFVATLLMATAYVFSLPEIYESEAKILIKLRSEALSVDPSVAGPIMGAGLNLEQQISTERAILQSTILAEKVVDTLGLDRITGEVDPVPPLHRGLIEKALNSVRQFVTGLMPSSHPARETTLREKAIMGVMRNLSVDAAGNIISVRFKASRPELAHDVLATLVNLYLQRHIEVLVPEVTPQFFEEQCAAALAQLTQKEQDLKDFQEKFNVDSVDDQKALLVSQISELKTTIAQANADINASNTMINFLENFLKEQPEKKNQVYPTGRTSPTLEFLRQRLTEFKLREAELASRYPDDSRQIVDLREQIRTAEAALSEERKNLEQETPIPVAAGSSAAVQSPEMMLQSERTKLAGNTGRREALTAELDKSTAELKSLIDHELTLKRLLREVQEIEETYSQYRDNLQKSQITIALERGKFSNLRVVQPAIVPVEPKQTRKERYRNIAAGVFLALFGSVALAVTAEYIDHSIKTATDVQKRLGLPVLATVSYKEFKPCI